MTGAEPSHLDIDVGGKVVSVLLRRSDRAQRMSLRVPLSGDGVVLVLPKSAALTDGLRFAHSKSDWIEDRLALLPARVAFADGAVIPLFGIPHVLRHSSNTRCGVWAEDGVIFVSGKAEHLSRRVTDWLKRQARDAIALSARRHAAALGKDVGRITLRDPRSRWGSCAACGNLSFSWRLVLAPRPVLEYVAAHEVAHLVEMNHSDRFWRIVATLAEEMATARTWLRRNGGELHRFG